MDGEPLRLFVPALDKRAEDCLDSEGGRLKWPCGYRDVSENYAQYTTVHLNACVRHCDRIPETQIRTLSVVTTALSHLSQLEYEAQMEA